MTLYTPSRTDALAASPAPRHGAAADGSPLSAHDMLAPRAHVPCGAGMQGGQRVRDQLGQHDRPQQERRTLAPAALWQDTGVAGGRLGALRISAWSKSRAWQLPRSVNAPPQVLSSSGDPARGRPPTALHWPRVLEPAASPGGRCGCLLTTQESLAICEYLCARFPGAAADKLLPPPGRPRAEVHQWVSVEATELRPHALKPCEPPHPTPPHSTAPHRSDLRAGRLTGSRALHAPYSRARPCAHPSVCFTPPRSPSRSLPRAQPRALSPTLGPALCARAPRALAPAQTSSACSSR